MLRTSCAPAKLQESKRKKSLNMPDKTFLLKHIHKATYEIWLASYWQV